MLKRSGSWYVVGILCVLALSSATGWAAQNYGARLGHQANDGTVMYRSEGPKTLLGNVEPSVRKRYLPQELYQEYQWQTWQYTNYAGNPYQRYVAPSLWGDYFYDVYGNFLTRGWLVYDWTEDHPRISEGSRLLKRGAYAGFFSSLIVASDQKGQYSFSISVGDELVTTLTPMTFRKSVYNGAQVDLMSDAVELTGIFSRISAPGFITDPNPASFNNYTNLIGGRTRVRLGDAITLGGVFVNSHNGRGTVQSFEGNPFKGELTSLQLQNQISTIVIRLSDDSPADNVGGSVLLADNVEIATTIGDRDTVLVGNEIGFTPHRQGGTIIEGVRTANGTEQITLRYDLNDLAVVLDDKDAINNIRDLRFRLVLVNDYRIEITSDQQTNFEGQPVFLLMAQAEGNIQDGSNKREVVFNYGLPTANQLLGFTIEARDFLGFDFYTEFDVNHQYRKYPNRRVQTHRAYSGLVGDENAKAWMMNLSKSVFSWSLFVEGFYMDEAYNTSPFISDGSGRIDYEDGTRSIYDFVDDNDDQDKKPDQKRRYQDPRTGEEFRATRTGRSAEGFADEAVFPGWDQNNDFISDFNQNSNIFSENRFPDYEEPFLRYGSDRPEYLFGIDLNNNGWVDQFENDNLPDYPYKRDRKGYNLYLRNQVTPHLQLTAGQAREQLLSDDRQNLTTYALVSFEKEYAQIGRVRIFDMVKKAADDIQDDLFQWVQVPGLPGSHQAIDDPLFAQDTWINTFWLGLDRRTNLGVNFSNKFKYETVRQREKGNNLGFKDDTRFLGIINKADYLYQYKTLTVRPKIKSEFLKDNTPYSMGGVRPVRDQWTGLFFLTLEFPVLRRTTIETGIEQLFFRDSVVAEDDLAAGEFTEDFNSTVLAMQLSNRGNYLGYVLTAQLGYSIRRISRERVEKDDRSQMDSTVFMTVYASLKD